MIFPMSVYFQVDGLDIVVGGHTNTFLWHGSRPSYVRHIPMGLYPTVVMGKSGDHALVVQTNGYGRYLGQLHVTFDEDGNAVKWNGNPILLNNTYPQATI
jgi:2',3'-cyclic-nucleotide 2'-phosphodiesterase (5'-nucleotidase family)